MIEEERWKQARLWTILPGGRRPRFYSWRVRGRVIRQNLREIWIGLRGRPLALLGGIVIVVYILAAIFAPQITRYDPTRGDLRQRLLAASLAGGRRPGPPAGDRRPGSRPADPHHLWRSRLTGGGPVVGGHLGGDRARPGGPGRLLSRLSGPGSVPVCRPAAGFSLSHLCHRRDGLPGAGIHQPDRWP